MGLVNPNESLERQNQKLMKIAESLMRRVEDKNSDSGLAYAQFERAALLEQEVRRRTEDLERALDLLHEANGQLSAAKQEAELARLDLADAIETVDGGFGLFGPDNRLVMANSRFCKDFSDVRPKIRAGLSFHDYVAAISQSSHLALPESMDPDDWLAQRLKDHGNDQVAFNVRLVGNRWVQVSEHRTVTGGTVILQTDVSDLMRDQREEREKLRDAQARKLQATLDHLDQGVCIFDRNQQLTGWNKRIAELVPISGLLREDLPFRDLLLHFRTEFHLSNDKQYRDMLAWAGNPKQHGPLRFEVQRNSGQILGVFAQEMPDRGFVISITDVTAERQASAELASLNAELERRVNARTRDLNRALEAAERANSSKTRFVAAASHDLLQPLSAAKLFIQSVPDASPDPTIHNVIDKAVGALSNAEQIIGALLDISRLDVEELPFTIEAVPLSGVLSSIKEELTPTAEAKGLRFQCVDSSLAVYSDAAFLRRIIQNLAVNAVRYTEHGQILIGVRRMNGAARLEVWDTGPGIAEADQCMVFQEFKRLNPRNSEGGLGLGLAIVSRACARLGHKIKVASVEGKGSCFSVTLPTANVPLPAKEHSTNVQDLRSDLNGLVVLVVENDDAVNRALSTLIEGWGGQVISAYSGEEALALLAEIDLAPDALLLDYQLAGEMTGADVCRSIREIYGDIPARIITANRDADLLANCVEMGLDVICKPIDRNALKSFLEILRTGS